jgi:periplasmic divalent cation tolerance protein
VIILSGVPSLYWRENKIASDKEGLLIVETRSDAFDDLTRVVEEVHPYDVPEIVFLQRVAGNSDYSDWVDRETKPMERGA